MLDNSEFRCSEQLFSNLFNEGKHPDVEQGEVDKLDVISTFAEAVIQESSSSELQKFLGQVLVLVEVNKT